MVQFYSRRCETFGAAGGGPDFPCGKSNTRGDRGFVARRDAHVFGTSIGAGRQVTREERATGISSLIFSADDVPAEHPMAGGTFAFSVLSADAVLSAFLPNHSDLTAWDAWARGKPFAPAGTSDPFGTTLKRMVAEQADPGTIYSHIPSLFRGGIESSLVPDHAEFQRRLVADPIR